MKLASYVAPVVVVAGLAGSVAAAPVSPFNVARDSDSVVITVAGVTATGAPVAGDDYIDVPIAAGAKFASHIRLDDPTVRKIELGDASEPRVRVKLRTGRRQTQAIAAAMIVNPSDRGAVLIVPRNPALAAPAAAAQPEAAKPAIKPEPAKVAPVAKPTAPIAPTPPPEGSLPAALKAVAPQGEPTPKAAPAAPTATPATAAPTTEAPAAIPPATAEAAAATVAATQNVTTPAAAPAPAPATISTTARPLELKPSSNGLPWTSIIVLGGLAAAAGLVYMRNRRKFPGAELPPMAMRASMSLGGKARVVLLSADDRELLVAVDTKGVRLLDSWSRNEAALEGDEGQPPRRATTQIRAQTNAGLAADDFDFEAPRQRTGIGTRPGTNAGVAPSDDFDFEAPRQRTGVGIARMDMSAGADRTQRMGAITGADRSSRIDLINRIDRDGAPPSDQVSGLLRLRHAARAEDAAAAEPDDDGESPWAQHLMASLRRGGKPS